MKSPSQLINKHWALREPKDAKIRYDLIPLDQLERLAKHYTTGALIHWERNRESGDLEFAEWCRQSAFRHFISRMNKESDEDHASACVWNIFAYEHLIKKV
jgi:hypothetical protein